MKKHFFWITLSLLLTSISVAWSKSAEELLRTSDRSRGGVSQGVVWDVAIKDIQGKSEKQTDFTVKVKGTNVLAVCTGPARQKGETYLFNDRNLWVYRPNLRKPISVSTRQRLSGQTANGDIANTNYAKDYEAELVKEESINGEKTQELLLKAKSKDLTYDRIRYWISVSRGVAIQAEFLTSEGKPFKRATFTYNNKIKVGGKDEPFISEMVISESAFPDNKSILTYTNLRSQELSDSIFNVNNLSR